MCPLYIGMFALRISLFLAELLMVKQVYPILCYQRGYVCLKSITKESRKSTSIANLVSIARSNTQNLQMFTSRATDEGPSTEIAQYGPYYLPLNDFTASKCTNLYILLTFLGSRHQYSIIVSVGTSILKNRGWPVTVSRANYPPIQCFRKF